AGVLILLSNSRHFHQWCRRFENIGPTSFFTAIQILVFNYFAGENKLVCRSGFCFPMADRVIRRSIAPIMSIKSRHSILRKHSTQENRRIGTAWFRMESMFRTDLPIEAKTFGESYVRNSVCPNIVPLFSPLDGSQRNRNEWITSFVRSPDSFQKSEIRSQESGTKQFPISLCSGRWMRKARRLSRSPAKSLVKKISLRDQFRTIK